MLLLLAAPTDWAWAQAGEGSDITNTPPKLGPLQGGENGDVFTSQPYPPYTVGEKIQYELMVTPAVTVTGTPRVRMLFGEGTQYEYSYYDWGRDGIPSDRVQVTRYADYDTAASSPNLLRFSYTVQAGDFDPDGIIVPDPPIDANGGAIVTRGGTLAANLDREFVGAHQVCSSDPKNCRVNGGTNPGGGDTNPGGGSNPEPRLRVNTVRLIGTPASGVTYRLGEQIQAAVTFSEAVTGTPQLGLTIGVQTRQAVYDATQSKGTLVVFTYYVQATDADADGISIAANALTLNGGTISLASDPATAASLAHAGVGTDDTRRVDGSTDIVEYGNSRAEATLVTLVARTTGGVGETGQEDDFRADVATECNAEVAGALEQAGDMDYFRVAIPAAGTLTVETRGSTDTVGYLGAGEGAWLSQNDNAGAERNFRAVWQVEAGTYYVAVVGGNERRATGGYTLGVRVRGVGAEVEEHGNTRAAATEVEVNSETRGGLERAGDVDYFRVAVPGVGMEGGARTGTSGMGTGRHWGETRRRERATTSGWYGRWRRGRMWWRWWGGAARTATGPYTLRVSLAAE